MLTAIRFHWRSSADVKKGSETEFDLKRATRRDHQIAIRDFQMSLLPHRETDADREARTERAIFRTRRRRIAAACVGNAWQRSDGRGSQIPVGDRDDVVPLAMYVRRISDGARISLRVGITGLFERR